MAIGQTRWAFCQEHSDLVLAEGISELRTQPMVPYGQVRSSVQGNYLVSLGGGPPYYIGEAKDLSARIRQQSNARTSTFYKTFSSSGRYGPAAISAFLVQHMETRIGRKEIEEFGIVNIPAELNKFQRGKRGRAGTRPDICCWERIQARSGEILSEGEDALWCCGFIPWFDASVPPCAGVYVVRSGDRLIYIGESSNIGDRHATHSGATYFSALRRHVGTEILGFTLKTIKGKTRYLDDDEDRSVTAYLRECRISAMPVSFGRYELEEHLIRKHHPLLNRKENR